MKFSTTKFKIRQLDNNINQSIDDVNLLSRKFIRVEPISYNKRIVKIALLTKYEVAIEDAGGMGG